MTTITELLQRAMQDGDRLEDLVCFVREPQWRFWDEALPAPICRCAVADLPKRQYDDGYGGTNGPEFIAFSDRFVYVSVQYDGSEGVEAIPRHPDVVEIQGSIPWPGGRIA